MKCQHRSRLDFFFFISFFGLISWFTITVLISAVACLLCFKERRVERESVFTLSNRRSQKAPCPSRTVHSVFLELELLTVWCIWQTLEQLCWHSKFIKEKNICEKSRCLECMSLGVLNAWVSSLVHYTSRSRNAD